MDSKNFSKMTTLGSSSLRQTQITCMELLSKGLLSEYNTLYEALMLISSYFETENKHKDECRYNKKCIRME